MAKQSRIGGLALTLLCLPALAGASSLFDGDTVLEIRLRGPLGTLIDKKWVREEYHFDLESEGNDLAVDIRVRGNSRTKLCRFPPLRLSFVRSDTAGTAFAGQDKLKLVTHCEGKNDRAENNVLDEFAAYRLFNLITPASYRVRLLRVTYEDTNGKQKYLDRPYYAFLIESPDEAAARLGGETARIEAVHYSDLDERQTALLYVFQYLIANSDYSLVSNKGETVCCHNVDLFSVGGRLIAIPFDFDYSGLVDTSYAEPDPKFRQRNVRQRRYIGYCMTPDSAIAAALQEITALKEQILSALGGIPALSDRDHEKRIRFAEQFFTKAEDPDRLLKTFRHDCLGRG